tara:strand:+ start:24 stop:296 length:273 start_codon:yes stop_codon:yes gene_type:complete
MRFFLVILIVAMHAAFLHATEPSFKFTFGSNLGKIPFEINKMNKDIKTIGGIQLNSWTLSPSFSSFNSENETRSFTKKKENLFIKANFKF